MFNKKPILADVGPGDGGYKKDKALVLPCGAVITISKI